MHNNENNAVNTLVSSIRDNELTKIESINKESFIKSSNTEKYNSSGLQDTIMKESTFNKENNLYNKNYKNLLDVKNWLIKVNNEQNKVNNFIFMTFRYNQTLLVKKDYIIEEIKKVILILNRRILGKNWFKYNECFKFVFSIEYGSFKTLHSHLIINIRHITYKDFLNKLLEISKLIKYNVGTKENHSDIAMLTNNKYSKNIVITEIYSNDVYNYILKEFELSTKDINSLNFDNLMTYKDIYYSKPKN